MLNKLEKAVFEAVKTALISVFVILTGAVMLAALFAIGTALGAAWATAATIAWVVTLFTGLVVFEYRTQ